MKWERERGGERYRQADYKTPEIWRKERKEKKERKKERKKEIHRIIERKKERKKEKVSEKKVLKIDKEPKAKKRQRNACVFNISLRNSKETKSHIKKDTRAWLFKDT